MAKFCEIRHSYLFWGPLVWLRSEFPLGLDRSWRTSRSHWPREVWGRRFWRSAWTTEWWWRYRYFEGRPWFCNTWRHNDSSCPCQPGKWTSLVRPRHWRSCKPENIIKRAQLKWTFHVVRTCCERLILGSDHCTYCTHLKCTHRMWEILSVFDHLCVKWDVHLT